MRLNGKKGETNVGNHTPYPWKIDNEVKEKTDGDGGEKSGELKSSAEKNKRTKKKQKKGKKPRQH